MIVVPLKPEELVPLTSLSLVIGGARSGKSAFAERMVTAHASCSGQQPIYLATAAVSVSDDEMVERIRHHQTRRGSMWHTVEISMDIASALDILPKGAPVLLECLTLWLSNLLLKKMDNRASTTQLLAGLEAAHGPVVVVSNDVGSGTVPDSSLARSFRDHAGHLNQQVAAMAGCVIMVNAGLPLLLKKTV